MEKTFIRVRSIKDIVIFVSLIVAGSVLIALPTGAAVNITGFFLIFAGFILAFAMKTGHKDPETGETYMKKELYFQQTQHAAIMAAIAAKPESVDMREAEKGNALKLDIYDRKPSGKAYLQLFEYVPHRYDPCSDMYEYDLARVENLIR